MPESLPLAGRVVAVPEARQLDILAELLRNRGAEVLEVPLIAILDAPDPAPVLAWVERFVTCPPDILVLLTGEGLKRLLERAGEQGLKEAFVAALGRTRTLCRGPKPERVLRPLGLQAALHAIEPTTDGVMASLDALDLDGKRVGVQLYGAEPNLKLVDYLRGRGALVDTVAPYVYAGKEDEAKVLDFIRTLGRGKVDVVTFTSQPQYKRLVDVAQAHGLEQVLREGLAGSRLAAQGPIVARQLREAGLRVDIMPAKSYFMKPLVSAIVRHFGHESPNSL